jgi:hypothetical protein
MRRSTVINKQKLLKLFDIFGKRKSGAEGNCI